MILKKLGDLLWKFHGFSGLSDSTLSLNQINKLCWARNFELPDSKECWIMGKTTDWYSEGASKRFVTIASGENFSKFQAFYSVLPSLQGNR